VYQYTQERLMGARGKSRKPREIARALEADGWVIARTRADHRQYRHPKKKGLVTLDMGAGEFPPARCGPSIGKPVGIGEENNMAHVVAFVHEEDAAYGISFPDFPGCVAGGRTLDEVVRRGTDALAFHIDGMIEEGLDIPEPRSLEAVRDDLPEKRAPLLVAVSLEIPSKIERVNITIDKRLLDQIDRAADAAGDNRSQWLAEAARTRLRSVAETGRLVARGGRTSPKSRRVHARARSRQ
jgi:predicted RNase H-like HicB family nuclease/predicted RNA binding protein YcfA (HicA-like mRNA interferase family)